MTEREWLATTDHPRDMLEFLEGRASHRKWRLFLCGCCWRIRHLLDERSRDALAAADRYADGLATDAEIITIQKSLSPRSQGRESGGSILHVRAAVGPLYVGWKHEFDCTIFGIADCAAVSGQEDEEYAAQTHLLRDVFGNPFHSLSPIAPSLLTWREGLVPRLASQAYEYRLLRSGHLDPERLGVLADALEEAGADAEMVEHLRGPGPHVRGCHVVDFLTGRE